MEEYGEENVAFHFIPFNPGPDHQIGLLRNLMARLILKYNLSDLYIASESRSVLCDYFSKLLAEISKTGGQEVIFIDGLDQIMEDEDGECDLSFLPNDPPSRIAFVLGTRPNDTLHPLKLLKPYDEYHLPDLSREDFDLIWKRHNVHLDKELVDEFYIALQKNALHLGLIAKELTEGILLTPNMVMKRIADNPDSIC